MPDSYQSMNSSIDNFVQLYELAWRHNAEVSLLPVVNLENIAFDVDVVHSFGSRHGSKYNT
jgi:hypothetical protein